MQWIIHSIVLYEKRIGDKILEKVESWIIYDAISLCNNIWFSYKNKKTINRIEIFIKENVFQNQFLENMNLYKYYTTVVLFLVEKSLTNINCLLACMSALHWLVQKQYDSRRIISHKT